MKMPPFLRYLLLIALIAGLICLFPISAGSGGWLHSGDDGNLAMLNQRPA